MNECIIRFSSQASLAVVGVRMRQMGIWRTVEKHVTIKQKVIKHKPLDKLLDGFTNILAGGQGVVEINTRVRPDEPLQRAFGRQACADQSSVSQTLNVCSPANVEQMRRALQEIYRTHSQGYCHAYSRCWQVLDIDMSGLPSAGQGEGVTKGYFAVRKNRRGRQVGRVVATLYDEIVVERLYPGTVQLERSLQELVLASEQVLDLTEARRHRTIVRVDGGGGRDEDLNFLLGRDYHLVAKVKNWRRAAKLARTVTTWHADPKFPEREVGWVTTPHAYARPTRQVAIRTRQPNGKWHHRVLVFTLTDEMIFELIGQPVPDGVTLTDVLWAAMYAYDRRGGGVETSIRGSKQGLGLTKRNKHRLAAQEMLILLAQLAYNVLVWTRSLLANHDPRLAGYGILRMVRDVLHIAGKIELDAQGHILRITLNEVHALASAFVQTLSLSLARDGVSLNLGEI